MMKIKNIESPKMEDITLIASLPDMGRVGGLVSGFLAKQLDARLVAEIESIEKPWVNHEKGIAKLNIDIYKLYVSEENSVILFTGDTQPQDSRELYELCNLVLDTVSGYGNIKLVFTAGGYLKQSIKDEPKVYCVVNNSTLLDQLKKYELERFEEGIQSITWFNGLILGIAAKRNLPAIGLFAEIDNPSAPQPQAAKSVIKVISRMINTEINTKALEVEKEDSSAADKQKERQGFTPGVA